MPRSFILIAPSRQHKPNQFFDIVHKIRAGCDAGNHNIGGMALALGFVNPTFSSQGTHEYSPSHRWDRF